MADLTRIATNDISATGDDVETGFTNDDTDIKNLYTIATKQRGSFYGSSPPQSPNVGDKYDNSTDGKTYRWDGDSWNEVTYAANGGHADTATTADTATNATNHINDTTAAHAAASISATPSGNLSGDTVEEQLVELDAEKAKLAGDVTQVFSAADATADGHVLNLGQFLCTLNANGNIKIPVWTGSAIEKLLVQWKTVTVANGDTVSFATPFKTSCYGVMATYNRNVITTYNAVNIASYDKDGFVYGGTYSNFPIFYIAIGDGE
jgi:hypothetical protein